MLNRIEAKLNCLLHFFRIESPYVSALESNRQCGRGAETINEKAPRRGRGSRCRASLPRGRARCYAGGIEVDVWYVVYEVMKNKTIHNGERQEWCRCKNKYFAIAIQRMLLVSEHRKKYGNPFIVQKKTEQLPAQEALK